MKLDLLAIAAHPDDVELTCGGTLLKAAEQGYKTGILGLDRWRDGTRGTPETRLKESAKAGRILRVAHRRKFAYCRTPMSLSPRKTKLGTRGANPCASAPHRDSSLEGRGSRSRSLHGSDARLRGLFSRQYSPAPIGGEAFRPFKVLYSTIYLRDVRPILSWIFRAISIAAAIKRS